MSKPQVKHVPNLYLAIDQGGHSTRAMVFDQLGQVIAMARRSVEVNHPQADWVEQDPELLVSSVFDAISEVTDLLGGRTQAIVAAGLATQRSNVVCWDKLTGQALSPAISWQDRRTHQWLKQFQAKNEWVQQKTGLRITPHYGASKLRWCLDNLKSVQTAHASGRLAWGPLASFLIFRLTKNANNLIDPANAARTLLWNLHSQQWDSQLLTMFGVPAEPLPRCVPTNHDYGNLAMNGLGIPLTTVTGDQSAALFALGSPNVETAYINMGTGAFIQRLTGDSPVLSPSLLSGIVMQSHSKNLYVLEGTVNGAGSALTKIGDDLHISYEQVVANLNQWLAQAVDPPLFLNGVAGLGAPYWVADFPSQFIGEGADWLKLVAVAESIIFLLAVNLQVLQQASGTLEKLVVTGGLASVDGLCERLAGISGLPVYRPVEGEATARGLVFLLADSPRLWPETKAGQWFRPETDSSLTQRFQRWRTELERVLNANSSK